MNRHASMNRAYRLIWSDVLGVFIPVAETARGRGKRSGRTLSAAALSLTAALAQASPTGGQITGGNGTITQSGTTTTIQQTTQNLALNWQSFNIAAQQTVDFVQPSATAVAVNRILGNSGTTILGHLDANGQVYLINPNGVIFGKGAEVDVGGLVASTLALDAATSSSAVKSFSGTGTGTVVNEGTITAAPGGSVALLGNTVSNTGVISAQLGSVALGAGSAATLTFHGNSLVSMQVDQSVLNSVASNGGLIRADGGQVLMTAGAQKALLASVVNNTGIIEARGVTTNGGTVELLGAAVSVSGTVDVSGQGSHRGGSITVQAGSPSATEDGIADIGGALDASSADGTGGRVTIDARIVTPSGEISANGATAGSVGIAAATLIQSGAISADATTGTGGRVTLTATDNIIQTSYASTTADSTAGAGGTVTLSSTPTGRVFSSGSISAQGNEGGAITLLGGSIGLAAANLNASGAAQGGTILVGGGLHGRGEPAASTTEVNPSTTLTADALTSGNGGTVVVWSSSKTVFEGSASARGGTALGNGGLIEVSSGNDLAFSGSGDAGAAHGQAGTLLLDPKNIVIDNAAGNVAQFNLIDPDAGLGTGFGTQVVQLSNGTVLVTKPGDTVGGSVGAGSIFYYNPTTGALLASFQGSHAGDAVGSLGLLFLNYTNYYNQYTLYEPQVNDTTKAYLISSPSWNNGAGAVTWVAANSTVSGILSSSNSLVGASSGDAVGATGTSPYFYNNIYMLPNDNYVVFSPNWSNGKGAATFGTAGAALTGVVSSTNSLVGSTSTLTPNPDYNTLAGDNVGSGALVLLTNNNFVILSPNWNAGAGAVTFGTQAAGMPTGVLGSSNSLVGATGSQVYTVTGSLASSTSNAYYGGDAVGSVYGSSGIYPLANGGYVVVSPGWHHDEGAVTVGSGTTGVTGIVSTTNSLTGTTPGIGTGGVRTGTYNGSTYYTSNYGYRNDYGGDQLGSGGITQLANGNWIISSPGWHLGYGAVTFLPSSTTALGTGGSLATVTAANSLVGSHPSTANFNSYDENALFAGGDSVGYVTALPNSNYVVASGAWNGTFGAATLMDGSNGHTVVGSGGTTGATVSASNSLVGSTAADDIGTITPLAGSSNFVVSSGSWGNGKGEVTRVDGTSGLAGVISSSNSLVGTQVYQTYNYLGGDNVGSTIVPLANGNWVIVSPNWSMTKGAVTFELAASTPTGNISAANSLVGVTAGTIYCQTCNNGEPAIFGGDSVGGGGVTPLANNNFVILSPTWSANRGAVTFVNGAAGALVDGTSSLTGTISATNSLVGSHAGTVRTSAESVYNNYTRYYVGGDQIGLYNPLTLLANGNFVLASPYWNNQTGAVTFGTSTGTFAGGAAFAGIVGSGNSLLGSTAGVSTAPGDPTTANYSIVGGDQIGSAGIQVLSGSNFLVLSPQWSNTKGAVTWGSGAAGSSGTVSSTNSLVGSTAGDMVGTNYGYNDINLLTTGDYLIVSPGWNLAKGAVTFGTPGTAVTGVISAGNSLVGSTAGDSVGGGSVTVLAGGDYVVNSPAWNGGVGAATWSQGTGAVTGVISSTNSILGADSANNSLLSFTSTDPKAFFVTLSADNGGVGSVVLAGTDPSVWNFARAQGETLTIAPSLILAALDAGTSIDLEASNNITVNSAVVANAGATGALTLDAGNSVLIHANISTGNGALTIIGNDTAADGVLSAQRSSGTAVITVDSGAALSAGTAALSVDLAASTDKTYNTAGNVTLGALTGGTVTVTNLGSAGGNLTLNGDITATGGGTSILLATGGDFINTAGAGALNSGAGRSLVYSADPRTNTLDGLTDPTHYFGETYALNGPGTQATSGNIFLYSVVPVLTVTSNSSTGYGTSASALTSQITGFIDGDTSSGAVSGTPSLTTSYVAGDAVGGNYPITVALGSLTSPLGYAFAHVNGNVTVIPEALSIALTGSATKAYNGNSTAALVSGDYVISGLYGSDSISVSQTAGTYASVNAGTSINVSATLAAGNFTAGGGTVLSNYVLPTGSVAGTIGVITPLTLSAVLTGSVTKVYDGGDAAILAGANYQLTGLVGSQSINVSQTVGSYVSANVGTGLAVSATLVNGNYTAGNGTLLSNYSLPTSATGAIGAITPASLTVTGTTVGTRVYNGTTAASLTGGTLVGVVGGDTVSLTQAGTFASKDVGNGIAVTAADVLSGASAGDYSITQPVGLTGTITPDYLSVTGTMVGSKVYNGTTAASLTGGTLVGVLGGDTVSLTQAGTFASKDVGNGIAVTAADSLSGASASDYSITQPVGLTGTITPASLTVTGTTVGTRVYNGTTAASLTGGSLVGVVGGDTVSLTQAGTFASKDVGNGIAVTAADVLSGASAGDYSITQPVGLTGTITPASLTVTGTTVGTRVYNGTTAASLTGGSLVGVVGGDTVSLTQAGTFASKDVGNGIAVTAADVLSGASAGDYSITQPVGLTGTITPASLTVTGTTVGDRVYNGTTAASLAGGTLVGVLGGDTVSLTQAGTFASKDVGNGIAVTAADVLSGASAGDYSITQPVGLTGTITPASLTVTGTTVGNRVYNGTTAASLAGGSLVGVVGGDTVSLTQAGTFASKDVGNGIAVTAADALSGASAGDYTITQPVGLTGTITPASLTVTGTTVANSVYNGTTAASLTGGTLVGVLGGDTVSLTQAGTFASKNVGTGIPVSASDSLGGASAGDYSITQPVGLTGTITPASLTVTGTTVGDRVYNGTTAASLAGGSLVGVLGGDTVSLTQAGTFASKDAGTGIPVIASDSLSGASAGDYSITQPVGLTGTITPASLTVTGTTVANSVYNGTTAASLTGGTLVGVLGGDTVSLTQAGTFASKDVGTGIPVTAADVLSGASAGDYSITQPVGLTGTITPASLTVAGTTVANSVYNGTTAASLTGGTLVGVVGGDTVSLTQAGTFASKDVGTGIPVSASDSLGGASAGDYTITQPVGLTGTITPDYLTVTGTMVGSKVYNGTTAASLTGGTLVGVLGGDTVSLTQAGTYGSKDVGNAIPVTAADALSGASAGDYSITQPVGLTGTITPASLTVTGTTVANSVYNGTTAASLTGGSLVGLIGADTVTLIQAGTYASKDVGTGIPVTAADVLSGASAGDYSITQPVGLTGTITPASLTVTGTTVANGVYNGTTAASLTGGTLVGVVDGDTVLLTQAGTFASKNAGTGIPVSASDSLGGASAGDYSITQPVGLTGTITPASLTVTGTTVGDRVYNGSTAASLTGGTLVGVVSGDTVSLEQAGIYATKNPGAGIAVTATDALSGASAGDYSITQPVGLTATITPDFLSVVGTVVGVKVFNGTASAPLSGGTLVGVVPGDSVTLIQSGTFASTRVGSGIAVTVTDSLSGANAIDYSITEPTGLTGTISPAPTTTPSALVQVAETATTELQSTFASPQLGSSPQAISALPTIVAMSVPGGDATASSTGYGSIASSITDSSSASSGSSSSGGSSTTSDSSTAVLETAIVVTASMKVGANGTLKIENGGMRLPSDLTVDNQ